MATGSLIYSDNFDRADSSSLGSNWTNAGGFNLRISSNQVAPNASGGGAANWVSGSGVSLSASHVVSCSISSGSSEFAELYVRASGSYTGGPPNRYWLRVGDWGSTYTINWGRLLNITTSTTFGSASIPSGSAGMWMRIDTIGSTISFYTSADRSTWTLHGSYTDTNITSGSVGIFIGRTSGIPSLVRMDDFAGSYLEYVASSKANAYAVLSPPNGALSSKANVYGVLSPPNGVNASKVNVYAVIDTTLDSTQVICQVQSFCC